RHPRAAERPAPHRGRRGGRRGGPARGRHRSGAGRHVPAAVRTAHGPPAGGGRAGRLLYARTDEEGPAGRAADRDRGAARPDRDRGGALRRDHHARPAVAGMEPHRARPRVGRGRDRVRHGGGEGRAPRGPRDQRGPGVRRLPRARPRSVAAGEGGLGGRAVRVPCPERDMSPDSKTKTTFHTTPIYYVNDVPHPGHAYTTVAADTLARARRLRGGDVLFLSGTYAGWYCPRCEEFKDEDELGEPGHLCAIHERPAEWTEEQNYFFRLSAYAPWLEDEIKSGRLCIEPAGRRNEVLAVITQGLKDVSISRARVKWGIPVPEEPSHVFYVWMDALANYITALGSAKRAPEYVKYWEQADERMHFVGKEIIRFHCLYWPAMLHAAGLPVPTRVFAHGWLTRDGRKLSKTTGNTIDPDALIAQFGVDAFRYFFLREGSFGQDWDYTDEAMVKRY